MNKIIRRTTLGEFLGNRKTLPCSRPKQQWIPDLQTRVCLFAMPRGTGFLSTIIRMVMKHMLVCEAVFLPYQCPISSPQFSCFCHCTPPLPLLLPPSLSRSLTLNWTERKLRETLFICFFFIIIMDDNAC